MASVSNVRLLLLSGEERNTPPGVTIKGRGRALSAASRHWYSDIYVL